MGLAAPDCSVDWCSRKSDKRGLCSAHYQRRRSGADMDAPFRVVHATPEEAFLAQTEPLLWSGCLAWMGALTGVGYGHLYSGGKMVGAHRYAWERVYGPIPDGKFIDHTCWVRSCVEVTHLRLATPAQNVQSLSGARPNSATGVRGVYPRRNGYEAKVKHLGASHYLGTYSTIEQASRAAEKKRKELFGNFAGRTTPADFQPGGRHHDKEDQS